MPLAHFHDIAREFITSCLWWNHSCKLVIRSLSARDKLAVKRGGMNIVDIVENFSIIAGARVTIVTHSQ